MKEEVQISSADVLDWPYSKLWRQVNADPEDYWQKGRYPEEVKPNLKETVYWEHLMPRSLSLKVRNFYNLTLEFNFICYIHSHWGGGIILGRR